MKRVGNEGSQATYGKLYDVLLKMEEGEAAEKVKELTRGRKLRVDMMFNTRTNAHMNMYITHLYSNTCSMTHIKISQLHT